MGGNDGNDGNAELGPSGAAEALHDVSNALTVVLGWLEEAAQEVDPARRVHALEVATRKAREARVLAREAIGAPDEDIGPTPIACIVRDVVDALAIEVARRHVTVAITGQEEAARVVGSAAISHVLTNLLLNALEFTPERSTIHVRIGTGNGVFVEVRDEGPGVHPSILPRLFGGGSRRPGGAGIGLRHSREVARKLGGDLVHVAGTDGATFVLELRMAASTPIPPPRPSMMLRAAVTGTRVLVVEDDRAVCDLLEAGLGARGVSVVTLHDGESLASKLPGLGPFDAVLLDLSPIAHDLDGALSAVRSNSPGAGIVFISGSAIALEPALTERFAQTRWVRKPFELGEIAQALADLMAAKST